MTAARRLAAPLILALLLAGCGGGSHLPPLRPPVTSPYQPIPAGRTAAYRLPARSPAVNAGASIGGLSCRTHRAKPFAVHVELYARGLVLPLPAGVGLAPPVTRHGAYVTRGRCSYALRTYEPTGLVMVDPGRPFSLGALFAIWGQPLGLTQLGPFTGPVIAYVNGHRWYGAPAAMPLRRHSEIVLEADGYVPPHPSYLFPPGV